MQHRRQSRVSGAPEVMGELPMTCLAEEIETPVRAKCARSSPWPATRAVGPGSARLDAALGQLDFMLSLDIYVNETTRHADVILPGLSRWRTCTSTPPLPSSATRNHARVSGPVFEPTQPPEWQTLLRLVALLEGKGRDVDVGALDDAPAGRRPCAQRWPGAEALMQALQSTARPRALDRLQLRTGPYGDQFGRQPGGLSLKRSRPSPRSNTAASTSAHCSRASPSC